MQMMRMCCDNLFNLAFTGALPAAPVSEVRPAAQLGSCSRVTPAVEELALSLPLCSLQSAAVPDRQLPAGYLLSYPDSDRSACNQTELWMFIN